MSGIQKNLSYRAARSTRLLNNHTKDLFGQQRPVTMFGFKISPNTPNSNLINIGPGACYTHNGQRLFFYDNNVATLDLNLKEKKPSSTVMCYAIVVEYNYEASTAINEPKFKAVLVEDWLPRNVEPIKDITEINVINGSVTINTLYHSKYNPVEGKNIGNIDNLKYGADLILGYNQILIAKIIIDYSQITNMNIIDTSGNFVTGVGIYNYNNPFEQLKDYLGFDYFEPAQYSTINSGPYYLERWQDTTVAQTINDPFGSIKLKNSTCNTITHYHNAYGYYDIDDGLENRTPVNNPLYGYFQSNASERAQYKYASILDDGHSIKWQLQRLSEIVRVLDSRVGSNPSRPTIKDYQTVAPKDIAVDISNSVVFNKYNCDDSWSGFIIREGNVGWFRPSTSADYTPTDDYDNLGTLTLGDSHHAAITKIDRGIGYIYSKRLGLVGKNNGIALSKDDIFRHPDSALNDRELWFNTSLSPGSWEDKTLKNVASIGLSANLQRHGDYVDDWIHFGTDTSYERKHEPELRLQSWENYASMSSAANNNTPIHIGNKGIIVNSVNEFRQYGLFAGLDILSTIGILSFNYANRSSIVGGELLNLSAKGRYDVKVTVESDLFLNTDVGNTFSIGDSSKEVCAYIVAYQNKKEVLVRYIESESYYKKSGYKYKYTPENFGHSSITTKKARIRGESSTISSSSTDDINYFSSPISPYGGYVNIVDRISNTPTFQFQSCFGAEYARHISNLPLQVKDWIVLGDTASIGNWYAQYTPVTGSIVGDTVSINANTIGINAADTINVHATNSINVHADCDLNLYSTRSTNVHSAESAWISASTIGIHATNTINVHSVEGAWVSANNIGIDAVRLTSIHSNNTVSINANTIGINAADTINVHSAKDVWISANNTIGISTQSLDLSAASTNHRIIATGGCYIAPNTDIWLNHPYYRSKAGTTKFRINMVTSTTHDFTCTLKLSYNNNVEYAEDLGFANATVYIGNYKEHWFSDIGLYLLQFYFHCGGSEHCPTVWYSLEESNP